VYCDNRRACTPHRGNARAGRRAGWWCWLVYVWDTCGLAVTRGTQSPLSHGFPLAFGTGSNGVQNIEAIYDVTHDP
jgi:hypothetical protein